MKAIRARRRRVYWTAEDLKVIRTLYARTDTAAIAEQLGRTILGVYQAAQDMGLHKDADVVLARNRELGRALLEHGRAHQFRKGQVPPNKGLRRPGWAPGRMAVTQFKKGQRPHTWKPIGSTRINADGYLDRKVTDTGYPPRDWVGVHRLVWIHKNGPIPRGHKVVFKPGRRTFDEALITVDALELVSAAELTYFALIAKAERAANSEALQKVRR